MIIGNPFTDVPELCSQSVVITDDEPELAEAEALHMAGAFWERRAQMQPELVEPEEAVEQANQMPGPVIFTDAADATSSGATGDSNALLQALIDGDFAGEVLAPIVDPAAALMAHEAGLNGKLDVVIGGALDARFPPLQLSVIVEQLGDGECPARIFWHARKRGTNGHTALCQLHDCRPEPLRALYRPIAFYRPRTEPGRLRSGRREITALPAAFFDTWSEKNFNVDAPGSTSANLKTLGHRVCQRPMYPLDADVDFRPRAELYR